MTAFPREAVETSLAERFEAVVRDHADLPAVLFEGGSWTYGELDARANRLARSIRGEAGVPTLILLGHGPEEIAAILATLKAGSAYVALDPSAPQGRLARIAGDLGARRILTSARHRAAAEALVRDVVDVDEVGAETPDAPLGIRVEPGSLANVVFTSGSTGVPNGVMRSHRCMLHRAWLFASLDGAGPGDRISHMFSCSFVASEVDVFGALLSGATLAVYPTRSLGVAPLAAWIERERISHLHPPPALFRRFLDGLDRPLPHGSIRLVAVGGEAVTQRDIELVQRSIPGCRVTHRYSSTEASAMARIVFEPDGRAAAGVVPAGLPVPDKELRIEDPEGRVVPDGEIGEVVVRSRYLADGYWGAPELTAERFGLDPDGVTRVFRTGDLGRWRSDGMLQHLGRADRQVKVRGYRVEPSEIESALRGLDGVREAAVVVREGSRGETELVAWLVPEGAARLEEAELRRRLGPALPAYMLPSRFAFRDSLPLTPTGKIDRETLAAQWRDAPLGPLPRSAGDSVDGLEFQVRLLWNDVMGRRDVGVHDDFFELGGDSIRAAELMLCVQRLFGEAPALADFVAEPTVAAMARQLRGKRPTASLRYVVPMRTGGSAPPFFCVHPDTGSAFHFVNLVRHLDSDLPFYALQARGMDGCDEPHERLDEMADAYLEEVRRIQPHGPYHLGGRCLGGQVAAEMARRLLAAGEQVAIVAVIDAYGPRVARWHRRLKLRWRRWSRRMRGGPAAPLAEEPFRTRMKRARKLHRPAPYPGRLTLLWAGEDEKNNLQGWYDLAEGRIDLLRIPGNHHTILREPHVATLAERLQASLVAAHGRQSAGVQSR